MTKTHKLKMMGLSAKVTAKETQDKICITLFPGVFRATGGEKIFYNWLNSVFEIYAKADKPMFLSNVEGNIAGEIIKVDGRYMAEVDADLLEEDSLPKRSTS